ncbi:hypothetical protein [uncultured Thomasclavelia sp.]|uniref:hypothetical protein n=1 Tax=uncultured Thomasclavelia sp. TaxID=3025759 RepID=UPI0026131DBA|nr:hypothetical protein [uncultured Thomasclavelia sp.]
MKSYKKPVLNVERFTPNEFVAACGDSGVTYYFECNAGERRKSYNVYFEDGTPYASSNGDEEWYSRFSGYHPCHTTHKANSDSGFYDGYMYLQDRRGNNSGSPIDVIIWTDRGTNVHCTTNLDQDSWETAKS